MWCPGDASDVDRERLEGAHTGVREGRPIGSFACLKRSHGHVPRCMGAERVQGERTHRTRPAGAKDSILIRCFRPLGLSEHGKILRAQCRNVAFFSFLDFTVFSLYVRAPATGGAEPLNPLTLSVTS